MALFSVRFKAVQRILGAVMAFSSFMLLPPIALAWWLSEPTIIAFLDGFLFAFVPGVLLWLPVRNVHYELRLRDGFFITTAIWVVASLVAATPFALTAPHLSYTDAVFEAVSGLTTTGATTITALDNLPKSVLFYRQSLNYFGGMGIVILAVAILPMLKVGGMQLFRAETSGPQKDSKLTPRIAQTARALWLVYTGLTLLCALAFWVGGMSAFDAITHAMATLSTGGFSTHDASFGFWNSSLLNWFCILFMILGGVNFGLHWYAWRRATVSHYQSDPEFISYLVIMLIASAIVAITLWINSTFPSVLLSIEHAAFQTVSNMTSTGFVTTGFVQWPSLAPLMLILIGFIGGCAGSTAGGIKVARVQMVVRQGLREIKQLVHPKGQFLVKVGNKRVSESVVISVAGFCALYILSYLVMTLTLAALGVDIITAFSAVAACINNMGPGLGLVAAHFAALDDAAVWVCSFAMILGRLEVFTVLVLLTPAFWQD
jgi:trk system potassium uptake protein